MTIANILSNALGYELKQFTIEGMTEKQWRELDDDGLMMTKSFQDYYNDAKKQEEKDIELMKTRIEENDDNKWWAKSIPDYTLKLKGFAAMTEEELVKRYTTQALNSLQKKFTLLPSKWESTALNKSVWLIATSKVGLDSIQAEDIYGKRAVLDRRNLNAITELVRQKGWDNLTAAYSGGHDSGGIEGVWYTKDGERTDLTLEDFIIYGARESYDTKELKVGKLDKKLNCDTMFGYNDYECSFDHPLYGPIRQRFGSWAGAEQTYGELIFYPDGSHELTGGSQW